MRRQLLYNGMISIVNSNKSDHFLPLFPRPLDFSTVYSTTEWSWYLQTYRQSLVLCDELICRFKLKLTPLAEQQRAKYLAVKSDAFSAKLKYEYHLKYMSTKYILLGEKCNISICRLLHTQVMSETYTSDIAAQLTTIRCVPHPPTGYRTHSWRLSTTSH